MPRIPIYDAGNLALRPDETGIEATAQTARRIGSFGTQAAQAREQTGRMTEQLGQETQGFARGVGEIARSTEQLGRETEQLGAFKGRLLREAGEAIGRSGEDVGAAGARVGAAGAGVEQAGLRVARAGTAAGAALASEGQTIGSGLDAVGQQAVQYVAHREISQGAAKFTALEVQNEQAWNAAAKSGDPNDPTVAAKFMGSLEPQFVNFKQGFLTEAGQQFAEHHIDQFRQHMAAKTMADMSARAGQAIVANTEATRNNLSNMVFQDPSSLDHALQTWDSTLGHVVGSSPTLSAAESGRVSTELKQKGYESIVKSAAIGQIYKTGQVPDWVTDPKYSSFINGPELKAFQQQAQAVQRQNLLISRQLDVAARQQADLTAHKQANDAFSRNVSIDPTTNRPVINPQFYRDALDVAKNNPNAPSAGTIARTLMDWGENQQRPRSVTDDPAVKADMMTRFTDPAAPLSKLEVFRAEADGRITTQTGSIYRQMIDERDNMGHDPVLHAAVDAIKERVGETTLVDGRERFANAMAAFWPQYVRAKNSPAGLPPNALNMNDEKSLVRQSISQFEPSPNERMTGHLLKMIGGNADVLNSPGGQKLLNEAAKPPTPVVGTVKGGYRFKGGDPADPKNWEKQ